MRLLTCFCLIKKTNDKTKRFAILCLRSSSNYKKKLAKTMSAL